MNSRILSTLVIVTILAITGCGEPRPDNMPKLYPTSVTITYDDGSPLVEGMVFFHAADPTLTGKAWVHSGNTDAQGQAEIITEGKYPGAPVSKFNVVINKYIFEGEAEEPSAVQMDVRDQSVRQDRMRASRQRVRYSCVEEDYLDAATTPLKDIEVTKGKNSITLKIGKPVKIPKPQRSAI